MWPRWCCLIYHKQILVISFGKLFFSGIERERHDVLLCDHNLQGVGHASDYSCTDISGILLCATSPKEPWSWQTEFAQFTNLRNHPKLSTLLMFLFLFILFQLTITMGYVFSPFVMSRMNTRPQFIAALLISAGAQVFPVFLDVTVLCHMS